jgi:hypothetical protein
MRILAVKDLPSNPKVLVVWKREEASWKREEERGRKREGGWEG